MKNILAIIERETKTYFTSPMAYVLICIFIFLSGLAYSFFIVSGNQADFRNTAGFMSTLILFLSPLITMRLFAEERKSGTLEVLLTSPVTETEAVIGKFGGALAMYLIMLILTLQYPIFLLIFGHPDKGPLWSCYLGLILLGSCYLSLGLFASTFTKNQIVAALITFGVTLILLILSAFSTIVTGPIGETFKYISFFEHYDDFQRGIIDSKHLVFYFTFIGFMLYLSILNIRNKKWR